MLQKFKRSVMISTRQERIKKHGTLIRCSLHNTTILVFRGAPIFHKSRSYLKILVVKRISLSSILRPHKYKAPPYKIYWNR